MSVLVAIQITDDQAQVVTAEISKAGPINLLEVARFELNAHTAATNGAASKILATGDTEEDLKEQALEAEEEPTELTTESAGPQLADFVPEDEIEATLAVFPSKGVVYESMQLPFDDPKRLDQIVPLQVQDLLPFDIDTFIIDPVVLGAINEDSFAILASLAPEQNVARRLAALKAFGADPKVLTTKGAAAALLAQHSDISDYSSFAFISLSEQNCSLSIFLDGKLHSLREFNADFKDITSTEARGVWRDIRCSLAAIEKKFAKKLEQVFFCGAKQVTNELTLELGTTLQRVDLSTFCEKSENVEEEFHELAWALGLFAHETSRESEAPLINFRRGAYAFKPLLGNFIAAIKDEMTYIKAAVFFGLIWLVLVIYSSQSQLGKVETAIEKRFMQAFPGEPVPKRREVMHVQDKLAQLEEQMRGLGSVSSLSPLESMLELSEIIPEGLDIDVSSIAIREDGLSLNGSVKDIPTIGRLNTALESSEERFCKVKVDSRGSAPGSGRKKIQAEITFCK